MLKMITHSVNLLLLIKGGDEGGPSEIWHNWEGGKKLEMGGIMVLHQHFLLSLYVLML